MLHERESSVDTESFLKANGKKFTGDCLIAMKLMYQGIRLNSETCWKQYNIHDRRLRNCREARPDIVKSEWKRDGNGKRLYVEFWIDIPPYPTKSECIAKAGKVITMMQKVSNPPLPETKPDNYKQQELF